MTTVTFDEIADGVFWRACLPNGWMADLWKFDGLWEFSIEEKGGGGVTVFSDEPYASRHDALRGLNGLFRRVGWPCQIEFPKTDKPKGVKT